MHYGDATMSLHDCAARRPDRGVRVCCRRCGLGFTLTTADAIGFLRSLGIGDAQSPVSAIGSAGKAILAQCVNCDGALWEAWPLDRDWLGERLPDRSTCGSAASRLTRARGRLHTAHGRLGRPSSRPERAARTARAPQSGRAFNPA